MQAYDIECIVLGTVLKYGTEAAGIILPSLTPDKFIFGFNGEFSNDHANVWREIGEAFLIDKVAPTYIEIDRRMRTTVELRSLVDRLEKQYHISTFEPHSFERLAEQVDKQGIVYNFAALGSRLGTTLDDIQSFMKQVDGIQDVDQWTTDMLNGFRSVMSMQSTGYKHIGVIVDDLKEKWERQFKGEQLVLPNNGFPSLLAAKLFPLKKMAVIHGLSGSGKSTLVFQINLGTALGLVAEGIQGCVAINSLEMEAEDLVERMVGILSHIDVSQFIGSGISQGQLSSLFRWADIAAQLPIFVDETNFITTSAMEYRASGLHVSKYGPVLQLSSDYGELFKDEEGATEEQRLNKVFREQFRLSREIGASVLAISQSTVDKVSSGKSYIAGADGTRYSRGILQSADILAELWNPIQMEAAGRDVVGPKNLTTSHPYLLLQKYRGAKVGTQIPLGWRAETTTFFDLSMSHTPGKEIVFSHLEQALLKLGAGAW